MKELIKIIIYFIFLKRMKDWKILSGLILLINLTC
ncbi:hypothetical protein BAZSYMA_ACONTIG167568_2 [Bathymodiolus azoricus thioautotrophic gill symbiont]|uniref:Uncharacterized protein n=1 Tax=Bathymodiolus azoricus thioautotrophic gill symbiont TaxID=235205 RepID=A0A1H6L7I6_9GAMM|nr:hypothetical protein BAZSYMA_ACONTIG167568_2 [Bathymodiolus azoricus thioautotrophic gill symbiont]